MHLPVTQIKQSPIFIACFSCELCIGYRINQGIFTILET